MTSWRLPWVSSVFLLVSSLPAGAVSLEIEFDAHPVVSRHPIGLVVANPGPGDEDDLTLEWVAPSLVVETDGATGCEGGVTPQCQEGEVLHWELPPLAPGESVVVRPKPEGSSFDPLPLEAALFRGAVEVATADAEPDPGPTAFAFDLAASRDPVAPGETVLVTAAFGVEEKFPVDALAALELPESLEVVWASEGFELDGSTLSWRVADMRHGDATSRSALLRVDSTVEPGTLLPLGASVQDELGLPGAVAAQRVLRVRPPGGLATHVSLVPEAQFGRLSIQVGNPGGAPSGFVSIFGHPLGKARSLAPFEPATHTTLGWRVGSAAERSIEPRGARLLEEGWEVARSRIPDVLSEGAVQLQAAVQAEFVPFQPGAEAKYLVSYGNRGPSDARGAQLTFHLPDGVETADPPEGSPVEGGWSWEVGDLARGHSGVVSLPVRVALDVAAGTLRPASVSLRSGPHEITATHAAPVGASLALAVETPMDPVAPGETFELQVHVKNEGSEASQPDLTLLIPHTLQDLLIVEGGGQVPPGEVRTTRYSMSAASYVPEGAMITVPVQVPAEPGRFHRAAGVVRIEPPNPALPDETGLRRVRSCQAKQLQALSKMCKTQLRCEAALYRSGFVLDGSGQDPFRRWVECVQDSSARFTAAYEKALRRATQSGAWCHLAVPADDVRRLLQFELDDLQERTIFTSASSAPALAEMSGRIFRDAAVLCKAELKFWKARSLGKTPNPPDKARARFVKKANRTIERGVGYPGWPAEDLAAFVEAVAVDVAEAVGGASEDDF